MASDWVDVGSVALSSGRRASVQRGQRGFIGIKDNGTGMVLLFTPDGAAELRELLDRAAMPGQPARYPLYGCCQHCEHCGTCQQPGDCEHGYAQPPHLRPCNYQDCQPGHEAHGEAVVPGQPLAECVRLNCGHPQARHDDSRPGSPCEDCGCQGWTPAARQPLTVAAVDPGAMEALGELADAAQDAVTQDEADRCGYSEDPFHRCRVCHDYAAGRDREHPLTAGAQEAGDAP